MIQQTSNANMESWKALGWTIRSENFQEILETLSWPLPRQEELRQDTEDEMDLATANMRLLEIETDPARLVSGEALRARLESIES